MARGGCILALTSLLAGRSQSLSIRAMSSVNVDTPALILNLDAFSSNVNRMQGAVNKMNSVQLRPHAKCHKSSTLGKMQIMAGAAGLCAAKLTEVEVLAQGGIRDILLTNEIVTKDKIKRLAKLMSKERTLGVCVDNAANIAMLNEVVKAEAAADAGKLDVYIEVDVGQGRCGVKPGDACAELADQIINTCPSLHLKGIQAYSGWNQHIKVVADRAAATQTVVDKVSTCLQALQARGVDTSTLVITGGGTGSFTLEGNSGVYTELQPGSYCVMDGEYGGTQPCHDDSHYKNAMFVLTTVMSDASTHPGWLVVDAGDKAVHPGSVGVTVLPPGFNPAVDGINPAVGGMTSSEEGGLTYRRGGDEHGIVEGPAHIIAKLPIGSQLWLLPGHCDPTINFYDEFSVCRVVQSSSSDGDDDGTPVLVMESKIGIEGRGPGI